MSSFSSQNEYIILEPNKLFIVSEFYFERELKGRGIIKCIDDDKYQIVLHNNIHMPESMEKYMIDVYSIDSLHLLTFQTPKFSANHINICFWDYIAKVVMLKVEGLLLL